MRKFWKILFTVSVLFAVQGCFPSKKKASEKVFTNSDNWLPADFKPQKTVFLVQLINEDVVNSGWRAKYKKWNNEMREYMQEKYPYKYEFVSVEDIEYKGKKYSDYQKYPFGLMISNGSYTYQGGAAGSGPNNSNTIDVYDFYFFDRASGKKYPVTKKFSSNPVMTFMPVINTILEKK
ncbi:MAG: hypothetical protein SGI83_00965 [Bacteroidota bacterium]|nr:hypothetical protein [Bacteroidota bacterium]